MFCRFHQCDVEIEYQKNGEKEKTIEKTVKGEEVLFLGDTENGECYIHAHYHPCLALKIGVLTKDYCLCMRFLL